MLIYGGSLLSQMILPPLHPVSRKKGRQYDSEANREQMKKKIMCDEMKELAEKYKEMKKVIEGPSSV